MNPAHRSAAAALAAVLFAGPFAATAGAQPADLDPIEVTATRSSVALADEPAAVTVLDADEIARGRPLISLAELLAEVPGLFVQNAGNYAQDARLALRGFGARSAFGIRGVAIVVDGIPQTLPDGQSQVDAIDLAAVERIEVLRGPASVLYGNAAGGVIRITTRAPAAGPSAAFEQLVGRHGVLDTRAALGGGSDEWGLRLSAARLERDGFRDHSAVRQYRAGAALRWQPASATRLDARLAWFDAPDELDPGGLTASVAAATPRAARPANVAFDAGESLSQWRLGSRLSHRFGSQELALTGFAFLRDFANRLPFENGGQVAFEREFTGLDARWAIDGAWAGRPQRLTAGVDLRRQVDDRERFDNLGGVRGPRVLAQRERVESLGAYVQHRIELAPDWTLRTGLRFDEVRLDVTDRFLANGDDSGGRTWSEWSPGAGLIWRAGEALSLFANVGTAFQTPTTTELANPEDPGSGGGFNRALGPQSARSYELGLRGRAGTRLRYEAVAFAARIDDAIVSFEVPEFSGTGRDFFRNAGRATRRGLELAADARLAAGFELRAGYTWSDFEYDRFVTPDGDFDGNRIPGVPRHRAFASLDWTGSAGAYAGADVRAASEVVADNANTAASPDYAVVDLHAGRRWTFERLAVDFSLGVGNVLDERWIDNVRVNAFGGRYFEPAPGRTWHLRLRLARPE
jgi:iron complex outermembrane receptor protein